VIVSASAEAFSGTAYLGNNSNDVLNAIGGRVFQTGKLWTGNTADLVRLGLDNDPALAEGCKTGCVLPLISRDRVLGILGMARLEENPFTPGEVELATQDLGTGTRTMVAKIAAETFGLPLSAIKVKLGDKVSEGSLILTLESAAGAGGEKPAPAARTAAPAAPKPASAPAPTAPVAGVATYSGKADVECAMLVIGAGPGGYSAAFRAADAAGAQTKDR